MTASRSVAFLSSCSALALSLLLAAVPGPAPGAAPAPAPATAAAAVAPASESVVRVGMTVADMERSLAFYVDVLGCAVVSDRERAGEEVERETGVFGARTRTCELALGDERIELTEFLAPNGRPLPADSRSNDRWFQHVAIIVRDMDAAYAHLRAHHVRHASSGPQTIPAWNKAAGGIRAFYFRDPDDHVLEVLWFPEGKGAARWHAAGDRLFLGIDHTAIVVGDTEASLAFYRDRLGMRVVGASENWGTEQEHLNNVFGARLRITSLRFPAPAGDAGPAIELLEYLAPRDGRPIPADLRANDLAHWHIVVGGAPTTSAVADPDGHVLRFAAENGGS